MKKPLNLITGDWLVLPTREERYKARLARMRHIVWMAVKAIEGDAALGHGRLVMYTLTYAGVKDWRPRHIGGCMRWLRGQGVKKYVWVGELQMRGAVHYHVLCLFPADQAWIKPSGENGGWSKGFTWVTNGIRFPLYLMKYLQKGSKNGRVPSFPKGFRLYAVSRRTVFEFSDEHAFAYRLCQLPRWFGEGALNPSVALNSRRVNGGVSYGRYTAVSPYTLNGLRQVDAIEMHL